MAIKVLIVDDMIDVADAIEKNVRNFFMPLHLDLTIEKAYTVDDAIEAINTFKPHLVTLDLAMNDDDLGGFEVWKNATYRHFETIILTAGQQPGVDLAQYATTALNLNVNPIRFVTKTYTDLFKEALQEAYQKIITVAEKYRIDQILYIETIPHTATVNIVRADTIEVRNTKKTYKEQKERVNQGIRTFPTEFDEDNDLSPLLLRPLFMVHGSFVANLMYVERWQSDNGEGFESEAGFVRFTNGKTVEVSHRNKRSLLKILDWYQKKRQPVALP